MTRPSSYNLRPEWYTEVKLAGVLDTLPGIYEWRVDGIAVYIGQYTRVTRPRLEYTRNVHKLLNGLPYRKSKPDQFRAIHHELAGAVRTSRKITLTLLENVPDKSLRNQREAILIRVLRQEQAAQAQAISLQ